MRGIGAAPSPVATGSAKMRPTIAAISGGDTTVTRDIEEPSDVGDNEGSAGFSGVIDVPQVPRRLIDREVGVVVFRLVGG